MPQSHIVIKVGLQNWTQILSSLYPTVLDTANVRLGVGVHLHASDKGLKVLSSSSNRSRYLMGSGLTGSEKESWVP